MNKLETKLITTGLLDIYSTLKHAQCFAPYRNHVLICGGEGTPNKIGVLKSDYEFINNLNLHTFNNSEMNQLKKTYRKTKHVIDVDEGWIKWVNPMDESGDSIATFPIFSLAAVDQLLLTFYPDPSCVVELFRLPKLDYTPLEEAKLEELLDRGNVTLSHDTGKIESVLHFNCGCFPEINTNKTTVDQLSGNLSYTVAISTIRHNHTLMMDYADTVFAFKYSTEAMDLYTMCRVYNA